MLKCFLQMGQMNLGQNTYGIWGKEVDQLGLQDLLEYRWKNTVSFFGHGALEEQDDENKATEHSLDYGLFDKKKLHNYWFNECNKSFIKWHQGFADKIHFEKYKSIVTTKDGKTYSARLVVDATGYDPVFLKLKSCGPLACLLYTSPSPRDPSISRMPSSA